MRSAFRHATMRAMRRLCVLTVVVLVVASAIAVASTSSSKYTASVSHASVNDGTDGEGGAISGVEAKGTFSGKLGGASGRVARAVAAKTGISLAELAKGGSYRTKYDIAASGVLTAVAKVTLKAPRAGTVCVKITEKPGKFAAGDSFVPMTGSVTVVGGTGNAAKLHGGVTFDLKTVTGSSTEQFGVDGTAHLTSGAAKGLSAACKAL